MLRPAESHNFLQKLFSKEQNATRLSGVDGAEGNAQENFKLMVRGFKRAEFSPAEITELLQLLAGLLHLSNVSLTECDGDILQLKDTASLEALENASLLLGLEQEELEILLQCRCMLLKGDILFTHRNEQQSASARCSLIKFIYSRIFDYIVHRLNKSAARHITKHGKQHSEAINRSKTIGILDIYGFESFGLENGLEQLCINYANDLELSLLSSLPDTSALLRDLHEGVFRRLDDSCRLLAQGQPRDDTHFWNGLFTYCASNQHLQNHTGMQQMQRSNQELAIPRNQHILFCLKGANGMQAAEAAANGTLLQHLQQEYLTSIGLVGAPQLQTRKAGGGLIGGPSAAGKVQERVFAVKHFAGTVLYGTDGWLELNNDRVRHPRSAAPSSYVKLKLPWLQQPATYKLCAPTDRA
ncbi:uncharacterized protein EMH_0091580 [Eimeria mitis]|uniref:Myosin motor domain-containing protein n=1 Tax=Eimeria mitis TaxID=44415 RepID=U6KGP3_9EIME|nr:uncharacterized protein EMH_0091580 [Eimeria mitis]CDJ34633.1 hypothetical protein EMH_0091580 [Eimeria mitis]